MSYEKLFQKGRIGKLELKNRAVMMPMATNLADRQGLVTEDLISYYSERAKGGIAMIINEYTGVDGVDSIPSLHGLQISDDFQITEAERLTDAVHMYDCKIIAQLHHGGATSNPLFTHRRNLAPSAVPIQDGGEVPCEMTLCDIQRVQKKFVDAAVRCKAAGYDGIELHGAHGYLIAQFFSRYYNRRTDQYGGSIENRTRFVREIIAEIRKKLGNYPILLRMCGDEMTPVEGFIGMEEGIRIAAELEKAGIDAINISMGSARNADANCEPFSYASGWKKHVAKAYKEALGIPVIATNTIKTPDFAEQLLQEDVCDFVGLGRSQIADPEFMNKARTGRTDEIRTCIGCLYCRERVLRDATTIRCSVNARAGREHRLPNPVKNGQGRKAAVIGGGPAGLEAALVLARRGFAVTLFEKEKRLGGTLNTASLPPYKKSLSLLTDTLAGELSAAGVEIRLSARPDPIQLKNSDYEGVIIAVGAAPLIPSVPGIGRSHVILAEAYIRGVREASGKTVVIGSGLTGLETAEMLIEKGLDVTIVEMAPEVGPGIYANIKKDVMSRVLSDHTHIMTGHKLVSVGEREITLVDMETYAEKRIEADTVILAMGVSTDPALYESFSKVFDICIRVGDARKPGRIAAAIKEGHEAGLVFGGKEN